MSVNQLYQRRVKDVMSTHVVTVNAHDTVHEALELMLENKVSALPVIDHLGRAWASSRRAISWT